MNPQSPQQQPAGQSQGSQQVPLSPQPSRSKKPRRLTREEKIALISAASAIIVAIVTYVLAPIVVSKFGSTPTPIPTASPTTAPTASGTTSNVYPPVGWKLAFSDPLKSSSGYWPVEKDKMGGCEFANDVYQVSRWQVGGGHYCSPDHFNFTDFTLEAQMIITKGDEGVMLFRVTDTGNYYAFWISPSGTTYALEIWENNTFSKTLVSSSHTAIHTGLYQLNTVAVVAQGNTFHLYVNDQLINVVTDQDSSYGHGNIYLEAYSVSNPTEVLFSNVKVWTPGS